MGGYGPGCPLDWLKNFLYFCSGTKAVAIPFFMLTDVVDFVFPIPKTCVFDSPKLDL